MGELPDPTPAPGEVRVRLSRSGVNPGDTKKRAGWLGAPMGFPRIVPHSDGAGRIDAVGDGVSPARIAERVRVWGAQSYRPFGTAAQLTCVPAGSAVRLPAGASDDVSACLGIPGITAHRAICTDGPVAGRTVLVHGVPGSVSSLAAQLAARAGARVLATVLRTEQLDAVTLPGVTAVALEDPAPVAQIRALAPDEVDRIVEVALSENADLDAAVAAPDAVLAAYATRRERPELPFLPMLFANLTVRLLGPDDFPPEAKAAAAAELTAAAAAGGLSVAIADPLPLTEVAAAHDRVDAGARGRTVVALLD